MAITVKHKFVSAIPDAGDPTIVQPSNWNDDHQLTGTIPVDNGGTGASTLTGYVKGNGTSAMTAATTIPNTDVTGLGTMSTQNANNVTITGGSISGTTVSGYIPTSAEGVANGVATLDSNGQIPLSQIPPLGDLNYQGTWNATTNIPSLTSSVGTKGYYYVVNVAGTTNLNGITDWQVSDWAVFNGSVWQKIDNTDLVTSVNGYTGAVNLTYTDVGAFPATSTTGTGNVVLATGATQAHPTISDYEVFTSTTPPSYAEGRVWFDSGNHTLAQYNDVTNNIVHLGEEVQLKVINNTGSSIPNGSPVYITSTSSGQTYPNIALAKADTLATSNVIGLTNGAIANGQAGYVTTIGLLNPANTGTFAVGDVLYLSPYSAGQIMNTLPPTGYPIRLGIVAYSNNPNGAIYITKTNVYSLAANIVGTVAVANGGTGATTLTGYVKGSGTSAMTASSTIPTTDLSGTVSNAQLANSSITINGNATALGGSVSVGTVTSVTGTAPVVSSGGATPAISMAAANTTTNGYLTSTDWNTFNGKGSGSVTSVATAGTVNGLTLTGGPITTTGTVTLGGTLDLSSPPTIGNTAPNTGKFTTLESTGTASLGTTSTTYVQIVGDASYPMVKATGGTNTPLVLSPLGTGALQAQKTDSTTTGGNARGANAVDWQTLRSAATMVASATGSVLCGGQNNTASSYTSFVGAGANNYSQASNSFVGAGNANLVNQNGTYAAIVGGNSNVASGYANFIGSGYANSGTSGTAVTTQSGTMNGTTAVTLSGSNASIKVGQFISGTSIAGNTYVAAISGTSLTLSQAASGSSTSTLSFYTPHGVVVGGGNNQATGSYSFIGGGGDAGTAANRNVASGDWSVVGGGRGNKATGQSSFVGAGGDYVSGTVGNTAGGLASAIVAGFANSTTSYAGFVGGGSSNSSSTSYNVLVGGQNNQVNSDYASILGGNWGTTRSIIGYNAQAFCNAPITGAAGVSQAGLLVLGVQTTDATATVLRSNSSAASGTNQVILPNNSAYYFKVSVIAGVTGGGNTKAWTLEGAIKRGAGAGTTAIVGTVTTNIVAADAGASTWTVTATADTTNGGLAITFTGQAATTIRVVAKCETAEMTF